MIEITIISGKGGTGKTSLTGAFAHLAQNHVICDLDVDAPDLHLLLDPRNIQVEEFYSGHSPFIDNDRCTGCGECQDRCRFEAIFEGDEGLYVDETACEGCKVCVHFCPAEAIEWHERHCGQWYVSRTRFGPMVHAQLFPGQENSGRLVSLLRDRARELAEKEGRDLILSDGSPGIGCPVISSLSNTTLAVLVTEPTPSGRHDLERVGDLCAHFRIPAAVLINKWDINKSESRNIADLAAGRGLTVLGQVPYDPAFTQAMVQRKVITEWPADQLSEQIKDIWEQIQNMARLSQAA
jgi:MinD superfamily P-loop ATPase